MTWRRTLTLAILLAVPLAGCAAGGGARIEPPPASTEDPALAKAAFREGMALAREGRVAEAAPHYLTAAENGHVESQYILATMYRTGRGMPRDSRQAVQWYGRAAEAGYPPAQFTLGNMFMEGDGAPKNIPMAVSLFERAAEQGHPQAQYNLGVYHYAASTARDNQLAEKWFLSAARQGEVESRYALGRLYAAPHEGIRLDPVRAYAWFDLAAAQGHAKAEQALEKLEAQLSAAERAAGRSLARRLAAESTQ